MKKSQMKKTLNKPRSCFEIFFFKRIKILLGLLNGPLVFLMLREDIMLAISSLPGGWINNCCIHVF